MNTKNVFSTNYLPPIIYFRQLIMANDNLIDVNEYFVKQTYRNRCVIFGADGKLDLIVPILKRNSKQLVKDVKISNADNWKKNHWKSIEAAYRSSPYFEYYEDSFYPFYHQKNDTFLSDFNLELINTVCQALKITNTIQLSQQYIKPSNDIMDFRTAISPKNKSLNEIEQQTYIQVFSDKWGFQKNLSIIDLLFNEGPNALDYLKRLP
ncbi:MAG: WbqC family protein [Bacteroidetes bacterium]|nr:WbqC family protein [Bacteroidota bacterium]